MPHGRALGQACGVLVIALVATGGCGRGQTPTDPGTGRLFADRYTEDRLGLRLREEERLVLDFTAMARLDRRVAVRGADHHLAPDGLHLAPRGDDPMLLLAVPGGADLVRVELAASRGGHLRVYWATEDEAFAEARSASVVVAASTDAVAHEIERARRNAGRPSRLRIDPIDVQAPVRIERVALVRARRELEDATRPGAGKVCLGGETRFAVAMQGPPTAAATVRGGPGRRLAFGLALEPTAPAAVALRVRGPGGAVLLEERLEPGAGAWGDREIDLASCPRRDCPVAFEIAPPTDGGDSPVVFLANPRVVDPGRRHRQPNVVLVSIDTLRADEVGWARDAVTPTPRLGAYATGGVVFERAYAASSVTHVSHGSLLSGSPPATTEFYWLDGVLGEEVTLAEALRRRGYHTAAFTGGVLVSESLGFDRGFETFYQHDSLYRPPGDRSDVMAVTRRATDWALGHADVPFFLFLHTYEVHGPYDRRGDWAAATPCPGVRSFAPVHMRGRTPASPSDLTGLLRVEPTPVSGLEGCDVLGASRAAYRAEIELTDRVVGGFLQSLSDRGLLDEAVVVLTADHGEAFFEHGFLEHGLLVEENLRVPLVLWAPGRLPPGRTVTQQVGLADVAPTVLELVGIPPEPGMEGRSLLPLLDAETEDRAVTAYVPGNGLVWYTPERRKLVLRSALGQPRYGGLQLYDLAEDPGERRDLLDGRRDPPPDLARLVRRTIERLPGVHLDLGGFAGRVLELEIAFGRPFRDALFAFDVARLGPPAEDAETLRCRVALGEHSRLVVRQRSAGLSLPVALRPIGTSSWQRFQIEVPDRPLARRRFESADGADAAITVWRVGEPAGGEAPISREEAAQLRALGYLQ